MSPQHVAYQLALLGCRWLCLMLHSGWLSPSTASHPKPPAPIPSTGQRSKEPKEPKAFEGLPPRPPWAAGAPDAKPPPAARPRRPAPMPPGA